MDGTRDSNPLKTGFTRQLYRGRSAYSVERRDYPLNAECSTLSYGGFTLIELLARISHSLN
jgi:hypothetical protein